MRKRISCDRRKAIVGRIVAPPARRGRVTPIERGEQGGGDGRAVGLRKVRRGGDGALGERVDDSGQLRLRIAVIGEAGLRDGGRLRALAPDREPARGRPIEQQRAAEQSLDRVLDLGPQRANDPPQPLRHARLRLQNLEIVADRLLARDGRQRTEDRAEPADLAFRTRAAGVDPIGARVDIDEPPIDLALRGPSGQRVDRAGERGVDQHRSVDQRHRVERPARRMGRHDPVQEGIATGPVLAPSFEQRVDLGEAQRGEGAGKASGGPGGEHQFGQRGVGRIGLPGNGVRERDRQPVLALLDQRRAVNAQRLDPAVQIGRGDEQVERMARRQQRPVGLAAGHRVERLRQQCAEAGAGEGRREPARANEVRDLFAHLLARFGRDALAHRIARPAQHPPSDRRRPGLGETRPGLRIGIDQPLDIGIRQPQLCQRLEAAARMDRLREEHGIDPAGARPAEDIGQHAQPKPAAPFELGQEVGIDGFDRSGRGEGRFLGVVAAARPCELPQLLRHAVHVDGEADPAVADQRDAQLLLAHAGKARSRRRRSCRSRVWSPLSRNRSPACCRPAR